MKQYCVGARLALGLLDCPYEQIEADSDLKRAQDYIAQHIPSPSTRANYRKGLLKLAQYLRHCCGRPSPDRPINWRFYLASLPCCLADEVRAYVKHRSRAWLPEQRRQSLACLLSHLTGFLRWVAAGYADLTGADDLSPNLWFDYVDARLPAGISIATLNRELRDLQDFLRFLDSRERPICPRLLSVDTLAIEEQLPRDVPLPQLRRLFCEIQAEAANDLPGKRYRGLLDSAWFLLMLHSGLRTGEIRRLRLDNLNLAARRIRIEQSKGLQDRMVYLSREGAEALDAYLTVRNPVDSEYLFIYRCQPLSAGYCGRRLETYGQRCGLSVTSHQLRHSCATLLLNAGASILTIQRVLGHQHIDTTLGYTRLYDSTIADDYYRAMDEVESRLTLPKDADIPVSPS